jgi:hypothetical protein
VNNIARILNYIGKVATVPAYSPKLEVFKDVPLVKAALAYDDAVTGETYINIVN